MHYDIAIGTGKLLFSITCLETKIVIENLVTKVINNKYLSLIRFATKIVSKNSVAKV